MRLILKSCIVVGLFGSALAGALQFAPDQVITESLGDENKIRDEAFMCLNEAPQVVLAGSSLSARLEALPSGWYNLSQVGGSPLTALALVVKSDLRPRIVVVESNVFGFATRGLKRDLLDEVAFPGIVRWRCRVRILQHKYRPIDTLLSVLYRWRHRSGVAAPPSEAAAPGPETTEQRTKRVEGTNVQLEAQAMPPRPAVLAGQVESAAGMCRTLAQRGTHCVFMEMPEDPAVMQTPFAVASREALHRMLPEPEFPWLKQFDSAGLRTVDGAHLDTASARRVLAELQAELARAKW